MIEKIQTHDYRKDMLEIIKNKMREEGYPLLIFGATKTAEYVKEYLNNNGIYNFDGYIVDDIYISDSTEKVLYTWKKAREKFNDKLIVVFGFYSYTSAIDFLRKSNLPDSIETHFFPLLYINDQFISIDYNYIKENDSKFTYTYQLLEDEFSKNTMVAFLNSHVTGQLTELYQYKQDNQYFNDLTNHYKIDTYVDAGAFDGDTLIKFNDFYHDYNKIFAFEPDPDNCLKLKDMVKENAMKNIIILQKGCYDKTETLRFSQNSTSAALSENGAISVDVTTIDSIAKDYKISYIKMDIEGSELKALHGSKTIISRDIPILAICVYHTPEDLITIPQYINSIVPEKTYQYYLKYHGENYRELVFYAIPISF